MVWYPLSIHGNNPKIFYHTYAAYAMVPYRFYILSITISIFYYGPIPYHNITKGYVINNKLREQQLSPPTTPQLVVISIALQACCCSYQTKLNDKQAHCGVEKKLSCTAPTNVSHPRDKHIMWAVTFNGTFKR